MLTVQQSVDKRHVDTQQLNDRLAVEQLEGPNQRLRDDLLPAAVRVIEAGPNLPWSAFLGVYVHLLA